MVIENWPHTHYDFECKNSSIKHFIWQRKHEIGFNGKKTKTHHWQCVHGKFVTNFKSS